MSLYCIIFFFKYLINKEFNVCNIWKYFKFKFFSYPIRLRCIKLCSITITNPFRNLHIRFANLLTKPKLEWARIVRQYYTVARFRPGVIWLSFIITVFDGSFHPYASSFAIQMHSPRLQNSNFAFSPSFCGTSSKCNANYRACFDEKSYFLG